MSGTELVLFLHSTGTGPMLWAGVPDAAIGSRPRLLPANIGYPPEPPLPRGSVVTAADDAAHILAAVPATAERIHIVAHSYGALVALHAVRALGGRVASLFMYEPVVFGGLVGARDADPAAVEQARSFAAHPWFLTDTERGGRAEWMEMFVDYWNRPGSWSRMPASLRENTLAVGWKMFQEVRACFIDETPLDAWQVPAATTVGVGERTTVASRAMSRTFASTRPNVTLVELAGAGHMAPLMTRAVHDEIACHFERLGG